MADEILAQLHDALAKELLRKINSGEATAADFSAAAKFLKDNGIDADFKRNPGLKNLGSALQLPFAVDEDTLDDLRH